MSRTHQGAPLACSLSAWVHQIPTSPVISHLSTSWLRPCSGLWGLREGTLQYLGVGDAGLDNPVLQARCEVEHFLVPPHGSHLRFLGRLL